MPLVGHQANIELSKHIGLVPERLPLKTVANIRHADALKVDWGGGRNTRRSDDVCVREPAISW